MAIRASDGAKKEKNRKKPIFAKVIGNLNVSPIEYQVLVFTVTFHSGCIIKFLCHKTSGAPV